MDNIQARLDQAKKDRELIDNQIKELEGQLVKPKHGDIVVNECGQERIVIRTESGSWYAYDKQGRAQVSPGGHYSMEEMYQQMSGATYTVIGNVFDLEIERE